MTIYNFGTIHDSIVIFTSTGEYWVNTGSWGRDCGEDFEMTQQLIAMREGIA